MPALVAMQCKEEPPSVFNNNSGNNNVISGSGSNPTSASVNGRPTILEHIEEHSMKDSSPHVSRVSKKRRERKTPFSRVREQPDINADEAIFDTLDVSNVSSSSLDRSLNWSTVLHRHKRQASADRITVPASANLEQQPPQQPLKSENTYRQQMIIPDDTSTTIVNTSFEENTTTTTTTQCSTSYTLVNTSIEESSNFMEEASNHSTAVVMGDRTVTSPTSQFGNLSFATTQVSQEPVSFAGMMIFFPESILGFCFFTIV